MVALLLGAGRIKKTDPIDYHAGIWLDKIHNEKAKKGEVLATLYSSKPIEQSVIDRFNNNVIIKTTKLQNYPTILKSFSNVK
jgi:thymidine phosphorylase